MFILLQSNLRYMFIASIIAIISGALMVLYPGGIMALMNLGFGVLQFIISFFIAAYTFSEAMRYLRSGIKRTAILYFLIGFLAVLLVWLFNLKVVFTVIAIFLIFSGLSEILGGYTLFAGRYFLAFLGLLNIIVGILILKDPLMIPWLIAWYILIWGISRLFLVLEMKRKRL